MKAEKGIFLGYNAQFKGYRNFNLKSENFVISCDVKFDEASLELGGVQSQDKTSCYPPT